MSTRAFVPAYLLCIFAFLARPLPAAAPLFDFDTDADVAAWRSYGWSRFERSDRFATTGGSSLLVASPAWKAGMGEWPAFEARPPRADWSGYDRLVVDVINPGPLPWFFSLFVSDSKVPFREGLSWRFQLPTRGFRRFEIPLAGLPASVNRADIAVLHFFTERPAADMTLHIDGIALLHPGEAPPDPSPELAAQLVPLALEDVAAAALDLPKGRQAVPGASDREGAASGLRAEVARLRDRLRALRAELSGTTAGMARLGEISAEVAGIRARSARLAAALELEAACRDVGLPTADLLVATATSMEKVLPRGGGPVAVRAVREVGVDLARNEEEGFQVAVMPASGALRKVAVRAGELRSETGSVLPPEAVRCDVVGFVETKSRPPYDVSHVGWWPDPILDFVGPVDIAPGDLQTFWVRVRAAKDQAPGVYRGTLHVAAEGVAPVSLGLSVRVRAFALPSCSPLPTAMTFIPPEFAERIPLEVCGGPEAWKEMKLIWADFLADYYIEFDSLYRHGPPDFDVLRHRHERGTLAAFNFGYYTPDSAANIARFRPVYEKAKELGILDHAYIYGFDECQPDQFAALEAAARDLKREFPEVPVMTTSYDHSYGLETVVKSVDAWCPLTPSFDPAKAERARAEGRQVWWYICCGPHHPHANMFIEYPAIEGRLLMGAMTVKQRPDGFLYYSLAFWNRNGPILTGPFTTWNPVSWTVYHGDGSWLCAGPGGKPVPTIRLENYRDGQEDYAWAILLETIVRRLEAKGGSLSEAEAAWLEKAKAALAVPESLVRTMAEYSRDPTELYAWRKRLGDLIESSGQTDVDPWGKDFGVLGFRRNG